MYNSQSHCRLDEVILANECSFAYSMTDRRIVSYAFLRYTKYQTLVTLHMYFQGLYSVAFFFFAGRVTANLLSSISMAKPSAEMYWRGNCQRRVGFA
jgi:hypothetical protein